MTYHFHVVEGGRPLRVYDSPDLRWGPTRLRRALSKYRSEQGRPPVWESREVYGVWVKAHRASDPCPSGWVVQS